MFCCFFVSPATELSVRTIEPFFDKSLERLRNTSIQRRQSPIDVSMTCFFGLVSELDAVKPLEKLRLASGEGWPREMEETRREATKTWKSSVRVLYSGLHGEEDAYVSQTRNTLKCLHTHAIVNYALLTIGYCMRNACCAHESL